MTVARPEGPVLHAVVGHSLPVHFLNAVDSVLDRTEDPLLVVDNASPEPALRDGLAQRAADHGRLQVHRRERNEIEHNGKVGGLYNAYRLVFAHAIDAGFEYLHLLQGDMQLLWWDEEALRAGIELFDRYPNCVNVFTLALSVDKALTDEVVGGENGGQVLRKYGLTDTGLYDLRRWRCLGMEFADH